MMENKLRILLGAVIFLSGVSLLPTRVSAHCDGIDGPVVTAAKKALEKRDVNYVLIWVQKKDEADIKKAFEKALSVRNLNSDAKEMADHYFFETLVRIHRAGEGAPFTGLKPAGRDLGPAIPAADKAIESGKLEAVKTLLINSVQSGLEERFKDVSAKKNYQADNVGAGREYVEAYVKFIHYVEGVYQMANHGPAGHHDEDGSAAGHNDDH